MIGEAVTWHKKTAVSAAKVFNCTLKFGRHGSIKNIKIKIENQMTCASTHANVVVVSKPVRNTMCGHPHLFSRDESKLFYNEVTYIL
jgi:hypothetical protein